MLQVAIWRGPGCKDLKAAPNDSHQENEVLWGTWVAQSVKQQTSAQVMISWFVGSNPVSGSMLTAQSLEPALDSV